MVGQEALAGQWARYGSIVSVHLALDPDYSEAQCDFCEYGHRCCDLIVSVTTYEALGIMSWIRANRKDWKALLSLVKMRAKVLFEFEHQKNGKPKHKNRMEMLDAWAARRIKCPFYDFKVRGGVGGCSVYPVRPMNCRKAFGKGDCGDEKASGIDSMREDPAMAQIRASRVTIRQLGGIGALEMCAMITLLRGPGVLLQSEPEDNKLMQIQQELLTDAQILWGLASRPIENPWQE